MKSKIVTSKPSVAATLFDSMTREDLAATAKNLGVPVGKSRASTIANLIKAVGTGKAQVKMVCTVSFKPADGSARRITHYGRTLRTYVSGPGKGTETWLWPSAPVAGSPEPAAE